MYIEKLVTNGMAPGYPVVQVSWGISSEWNVFENVAISKRFFEERFINRTEAAGEELPNCTTAVFDMHSGLGRDAS